MAPVRSTGVWIGLAALLSLLLVGAAVGVQRQRLALRHAAAQREQQAMRLRALWILEDQKVIFRSSENRLGRYRSVKCYQPATIENSKSE